MLWSTPTKSLEGDSQIFIGHVVARTTKTGSDRTARAGGREPGRGTGGHGWWGCVKIGDDNRKDLRRSDVLLFESGRVRLKSRFFHGIRGGLEICFRYIDDRDHRHQGFNVSEGYRERRVGCRAPAHRSAYPGHVVNSNSNPCSGYAMHYF
ncbi:hypothetical protein EVAR_54537_1 [Eumeta japonica]|uniref:Uncharacterized protein n=1 Tax=Eumeta variegata TaxID=151549 RepID=A0A4C1ZT24_EUMVA|nr:hypothetical protein EVAR_54537_1 [Eumeta japonica]